MLLDKKAILGIKDTKVEKVEIPEWGGHVFVRSMLAGDLDDFEAENYTVKDGKIEVNKRNVRARFLVRAICDEEGTPLFTLKDVDALSKKSAQAMTRVMKVAEKLNGFAKEAIEVAEKNSERGLGSDSDLPLPANSE